MADKEWTWIDPVLKGSLLLDDSDICFYYLVRTSGGYNESIANSRIENFKKKPEKYKDNATVWGYKEKAIKEFARDVTYLLTREDFAKLIPSFGGASLVPIPTSKPKGHPYYDSRIPDMCEIIASTVPGVELDDAFDMKELVTPSHEGGSREVDTLNSKIDFDGLMHPEKLIFLVDDVILKGTHYVVCRDKIRARYPNAQIIGIFLAFHQSDWVDYGLVSF